MRKAPKLEAARAEVKRLCPFLAEYNKAMGVYQKLRKAQKNRAARRDAIASLGMKEVRGALGGRYIE